jgi:hypothetical protein
MDRSANVTSIDAIRALRSAFRAFEANSREAVTLLTLEVRKALDWLENDRTRYWPEQVRKASECVAQARNDLERCQLTYGSEDSPSCYEQKKALERAKRRLRLCEDKVKRVKYWVRTVRGEMDEFEGQMARINNCLDADVPRAVALLERMLRALERYAEASSETLPDSAPPQRASVPNAGTAPDHRSSSKESPS